MKNIQNSAVYPWGKASQSLYGPILLPFGVCHFFHQYYHYCYFIHVKCVYWKEGALILVNYYVALADWNLLCSPGWAWIHRDQPIYVSWVLGLMKCTAIPGKFCKYLTGNWEIDTWGLTVILVVLVRWQVHINFPVLYRQQIMSFMIF